METIRRLIAGGAPAGELSPDQREQAAAELGALTQLDVYPASVTAAGGVLYFLGRSGGEKRAGALAKEPAPLAAFAGETSSVNLGDDGAALWLGPTSEANAAELRRRLPHLNPRPLGVARSVGLGDRLGLATPGHVRALRAEAAAKMRPIFAQQSMRENARTGRTPEGVMADAVWGVFQAGWRDPWGADADHLKTLEDVDRCTAAGYTFYTIDPGEHVDDRAATLTGTALQEALEALPWDVLESSPKDLLGRLAGRDMQLGDGACRLTEEEVAVAAVKYGRAVAHTVKMARRLKERLGDQPFDLEVSVDETEQVTSLAEHIYIASELKRLGVTWVSMAPRYVGRFEKGVDYIGDLAEFERDFARHYAVAQAFGPYKLSLHSGSDKFSIYPIAAKVAGELVHLKTAGTSYLEALRAISRADAGLFRRIVEFALERYDTDRATYHVSADAAKVRAALLEGSDLARLLDDFHARQVLHVTFGSVLADRALSEPFFAVLKANEDLYEEVLEAHFRRHLRPFAAGVQ